MRTIKSLLFFSQFPAALLVVTAPTTAAPVRPLSAACETALAASAAPPNLQAGAGIYLLGERGYTLTRESRNGFHCLVERNHIDSIIPQCFDSASTDANLKVVLDEGQRLRAGDSFETLAAQRVRALAGGEYPSPTHGLVYMISEYNFIYNAERGEMIRVAPHVMYHAPDLDNADIGADRAVVLSNPGLPMINAHGPHGFMVSFTRYGSPTTAIETSCAGQLPDPAAMSEFPPAREG